jgi:RimJ/RimL family protein N-acetyltransferase
MSQARLFTPGAWYQIGIAQAHMPELIGDIGLHLAQDQNEVEIGFTLNREFHGKGLAPEAVRLVIQLAFEHTPAKRVISVTDARNEASIRLLERVGMRRVETRAAVFREEAFVEYRYSLKRKAQSVERESAGKALVNRCEA